MIRLLTAGESHGPKLTAILEGLPAGLRVSREELDREMARRQAGYGTGGRMKIEHDHARITGGVLAGVTTGGPVAIEIANRDHASWAERDIDPMTIPRPGHADLTGAIKYGYRDLRLALERASARETAARVAAGALCKQYLGVFEISVGSYVTAIGDVQARIPPEWGYTERFAAAEENDVRCPDPDAAAEMRALIRSIMTARDTLGGVFEVVALRVPPGLGSFVQFDRRLSARLAGAVASIPAIKGVEIGEGFALAGKRGTEAHDEFVLGDGHAIARKSNRAGGLEGGISTGEPIVLRAAMKPIATTLTPLDSVDLAGKERAQTRYERSDFCAVPRAAVVGEAVVALVLADELQRKLGGDSLAEQKPRWERLREGRLGDLPMDDRKWRFDYEL